MTADLLTSRPQAPAPVQVRLPVGGWRVGFRVQPDGRAPWGYPFNEKGDVND
jgi:hypothetical protein